MTTISTAARNGAADAVAGLLDGGNLRIYTSGRPATPNDAPSGTLLVELTLGTPAFGGATGGVATAETIAAEEAAETGTAAWFRGVNSGGNGVIDGDVGSELVLNSNEISEGVNVTITEWTITMPGGA